jgi:hypothetical protein
MATNFPSSLDSFTNPSGTDAMDSVTVPHATQHADLNDAVEALQSKVGVDGSAVTTSLDYKTKVQCAFLAYVSSNVSVTSTTPFNTKVYDVGSDFNTTTYTFTAPVDGLYTFSVRWNAYNGSVNDVMIVLASGTIGGVSGGRDYELCRMLRQRTGDQTGSSSWSERLEANDTRFISTQSLGATYSGGVRYNSFSGALILQD